MGRKPHTGEAKRRSATSRRGLGVAFGAAAVGLMAASAAVACTVGAHGWLVIVREEAPTVSNNPIDISVASTLNHSLAPGPGDSDGIYIDPDYVDTAENPLTRQECRDGDDDPNDDVRIGTVTYGEPAGQTPPVDRDSVDQYGYLYGEGTAQIDLADLNRDPDAEAFYGTYEICTEPDPSAHWDHFRIIDDS